MFKRIFALFAVFAAAVCTADSLASRAAILPDTAVYVEYNAALTKTLPMCTLMETAIKAQLLKEKDGKEDDDCKEMREFFQALGVASMNDVSRIQLAFRYTPGMDVAKDEDYKNNVCVALELTKTIDVPAQIKVLQAKPELGKVTVDELGAQKIPHIQIVEDDDETNVLYLDGGKSILLGDSDAVRNAVKRIETGVFHALPEVLQSQKNQLPAGSFLKLVSLIPSDAKTALLANEKLSATKQVMGLSDSTLQSLQGFALTCSGGMQTLDLSMFLQYGTIEAAQLFKSKVIDGILVPLATMFSASADTPINAFANMKTTCDGTTISMTLPFTMADFLFFAKTASKED